MDEMDAIISEFLVESYENLDQLDLDLVELEKNPTETSILASIFRTIHTIKGTCGFLGFSKLESIAHVGENLLSKLRDGAIALNPAITSALLSMVDAIRQILGCLENDRNEGSVDYSKLVETLTRLLNEEDVQDAPAEAASEETAVAEAPSEETPAVAEEAVASVEAVESAPEATPEEEKRDTDRRTGDKGKEEEFLTAHGERREETDRRQQEAPQRSGGGVSDSSIRVDVSLLDTLMNLVGELVLARNQILQYAPAARDSNFLTTTQHLNLVTTELQEGVMKTRMQPIGNIWSKYPRVVRDLSIACGKQVRLEMEGKETELDKTLIEAIKDPLTHIVRNSVDHGIETPEVRAERGKPEEGVLLLKAFHEGGQVNIEIIDDGGGINPDKIKEKAISKGLITTEQASRMSDREVTNLIFSAGFSTAEKVTNVSGRGVGMDVVKTNIEKIGGTVDIQSRYTKGTTLKVKIPLTLAIIPALIVTTGGGRYAIPQVNLLELLRLDGKQAQGIEMIQGTPVYRLRGRLLPLVYLNKELKVESALDTDAINIVVLQADERHFGLVVDGINDTEEIVVKPLGMQLKNIPAYSGTTIMGDGNVALILDVMGLAQAAKVITQSQAKMRSTQDSASTSDGNRQTLLIIGVGEQGRMAIPLSVVARLEEFRRDKIESSGDQEVIQYRGEIMPLIFVSTMLGRTPSVSSGRDELHAVVYTLNGKSVGLVVDQIRDIVDESIKIKKNTARHGILGTVVVQNQVTDLLDVEGIIKESDPTFFNDEPVAGLLEGS
ncbi:MAG: histidine kinase [Candidatus Nitrohelix vancouverensis]|uniref:histidine kinase n=1 Tax=Candidatus Nitrohelix vancouverensis TaxID=2705534 RepID=A0A7T0BZR9_9BACT|nr:MAG: histidine kinase [Candidatus Nitrohelix vancouverensis]